MPLYSELYHNFVGNTPIIPTPIVSVGSSTYSPPTYVGVSRAFPNPLSSASSRTAPSFTRGYVPKLTPITETPLTSTRIAALGRVSSPKFLAGHHHHHGHSSPTYQKPRRIINTADIDVSASKYAGSTRTPLSSLHRTSAVLETSSASANYSGAGSSPESSSLTSVGSSSINHSEIDRSVGALASVTPLSTRDQELNERSEQRRARSTINRNRTVVRLNTIRARSKSRGSRGSTEGRDRLTLPDVGSEPTFDEEMLLLEPPVVRAGSGTSWRDNFRDELTLRPRTRTEPSKSPGELLLEKHLIRDEDSTTGQTETVHPPTRSPVPKRRGTIRRKSGVKIPSFHEICADISSDKLDDDLNAGELRRRASQLIEDELIQFQEELKKAASNTTNLAPDILEERLKEALEQQNAQDSGVEVAEKRKLKKIKRTRTKVLPVPPPEPEQELKLPSEPVVVVENAVPPRIVAELESIEECTVFKLPKKKKKQPEETVAKKSITPGGLRKETTEQGRTEPDLQKVQLVIMDPPKAHQADLTNGVQETSKRASTETGTKTLVDGAGPSDIQAAAVPLSKATAQVAEPRKTAKTGIKTYVRKKTVESLPEPVLSEPLISTESISLKEAKESSTMKSDTPMQSNTKPSVKKNELEKIIAPLTEANASVKPKELQEQLKTPMNEIKAAMSNDVTKSAEKSNTLTPNIKETVDIKPLEKQPKQSEGINIENNTLEQPAAIIAEQKLPSLQTAALKVNESKVTKPNQVTEQLPTTKTPIDVKPTKDLPIEPITAVPKAQEPGVLNGAKKTTTLAQAPAISNEQKPLAAKPTEPTNKVQQSTKPKIDEPVKIVPTKLGLRKKPTDLKRSSEEVDFWSTIGTRETVSFARRKQQLVFLRSTEEEESPPASPSHPFQGLPASPTLPNSAEASTRPVEQSKPLTPPKPSSTDTSSKAKDNEVDSNSFKEPNTPKSPVLTKPKATEVFKLPENPTVTEQVKPDAVDKKVAKVPEVVELQKTKAIIPEPDVSKVKTITLPDAPVTKTKTTTLSEAGTVNVKPAQPAQPQLTSAPEAKVSKMTTTTSSENAAVKPKGISSITPEPLSKPITPPGSSLLKEKVSTTPTLEPITPKPKLAIVPGASMSKDTLPEGSLNKAKPSTMLEPATSKTKLTAPAEKVQTKANVAKVPTVQDAIPIAVLDTKKLSPKELIKAIAPNIAAAAEKKMAQEKTKPTEAKPISADVATSTTNAFSAAATGASATTTATAASVTTISPGDNKPDQEPAKKVIVKKVVKVVKPKVPTAAKPKAEPEVDAQAEREQEQRRLAQQQQQQNLERMKTKLNQITLNMGVKGTEVEVKECQKCQSAIVSEALPVAVAIVTTKTTPAAPKAPKQPPIANGAKLTKNKFGTLDNLSDLSSVDVRDRNISGAVKPSVVKPKQKQPVAVSVEQQKVFHSSSEEDVKEEQCATPGVVGARVANDSESETSFSGVEDDWSSEEEEDDDDDMANDKPEKKKPFDPTKRVKLNFDQMRKCYSKEEKSPIVLVARPRPLWKVKRHGHRHNRKADLTSSSSGSSSSDDESTSTSTTTSSGATTSTNTTDQTSSEAVSIMDGATSDINTDSSVNSSTGGKQKGKGAKGQGAKGKGQKGKPDPFSDIYDNPMVIPLHAEPRTSSRKSGGSFAAPTRDENNNTPADLDEDERARSIGAGHEVRSASTSSHDSGFYGGGTAPISPKKALDCDVNCHKKCEKLAANLCGVNQKLIVEALSSVRRGVHEARDSPSKMPPSANPAYRIETPIPSGNRFDHDCVDGGGTSTVASTSTGAASSTAKEEEIGNNIASR
uniref:Uncharacterized protein n=1 Tax=Anopheles culicifacies TaxID=139723 RepID=A0A182M4Y0_9DIPT